MWSTRAHETCVERVISMTAALEHRGPDDSGVHALPNGGPVLGHRRLSILDLSALGHQPMQSPCGRYWVTYNGEIYNFREIRQELEQLHHRFRSDSDTEVILAAYAQWGLSSVARFRGMFAFALWDGAAKRLHLCRDRFGVKPLYYARSEQLLAFASEPKALHCVGFTGSEVDPAALCEYVQFGYVSAPRSLYAAVRTVRPGTVLSFAATLEATEITYWSASELYAEDAIRPTRQGLCVMPQAELLDQVESGLAEAFRYRLVSDVPVGLFLSGGIDSSLVAALLARVPGTTLRTFTIGYGGSEFDESEYARIVAAHLGAQHTEFEVSEAEALALFSRLDDISDEPIGDSSLIPTLMVSELARRHVKVALSADGADELFGGYARYAACAHYASHSGGPLRALRWLSAEVLSRLPPHWLAASYRLTRGEHQRFAGVEDKLRKFINLSRAPDTFAGYRATVSEWTPVQASEFGVRSSEFEAELAAAYRAADCTDDVSRFMHFDLTRYLPGDLLTKVDRASMAVSLEAREPFLDHKLAALAVALPLEWKFRHGQNKFVLRRLLDRYYPVGLFDRPKHGFSAPVGKWLRGPLRGVLEEELAPRRVRELGLLDAGAVQRAMTQFLAGSASTSAAGMWFLLQLQRWGGRWLRAGARSAANTTVTRFGGVAGIARSST
jgi:asparagine synthase (glutamine-hydrolysing)